MFSPAGYPDELEVEVIKDGLKTVILYEGKQDVQNKKTELIFLDENERVDLINKITLLVNNYSRLEIFPEILGIKTKITNEYKKCKFPYKNQSIHNIRNDYCRNFEGPFNVQVFSYDSIDRIFNVYNTIYAIVKNMGCSIDKHYNFVTRDEKVGFEFYELQKMVVHEITSEEEKQLRDYERGKSCFKPKIRKEDYIFDGRLVFNIGQSKIYDRKNLRFGDGKKKTIEEQYEDIIIALYE